MSGTEHRPQGTPALHAAGDVSMGGSRRHTGRFPRDSDRARSPTELQLSTAKQSATTLIDGNLSRLQLQKLSCRPISEVTEERARCGPLMQISCMFAHTLDVPRTKVRSASQGDEEQTTSSFILLQKHTLVPFPQRTLSCEYTQYTDFFQNKNTLSTP